MSVGRVKQTLKKKTALAWDELVAGINKIAADCEVRPSTWAGVFAIDETDNNSIKVEIKPVVFRLKEKARSVSAELFVSVKGKVNFSVSSEGDKLKACYFSTSVGYFRINGAKLDHILGLHYDFDDRTLAHPVFHAQIKSCMVEHLQYVNEQYRAQYIPGADRMEHVAGKVRLPTAHMDPLAVFVQLLADHLLNENSNPNTLNAFEQARDALMFFTSDPDHSSRLEVAIEEKCFRGPRWYPLLASPPAVAPAPAGLPGPAN